MEHPNDPQAPANRCSPPACRTPGAPCPCLSFCAGAYAWPAKGLHPVPSHTWARMAQQPSARSVDLQGHPMWSHVHVHHISVAEDSACARVRRLLSAGHQGWEQMGDGSEHTQC